MFWDTPCITDCYYSSHAGPCRKPFVYFLRLSNKLFRIVRNAAH